MKNRMDSLVELENSKLKPRFNLSGSSSSISPVLRSPILSPSDHLASDDHIIYHQDDLFLQGFPIMEEIRRLGKLCDVTLKVDNQSFSAHRIVLAANIPYFYAMFTNDMVESTQRDITIHGIEALALEALVNFAYSGLITIDVNNVQSLMVGASFLQLTQVRNACAEFLKKRFHPQNVLGIRSFADTLGCTPLVESADKYLQQYFQDVSSSDEFFSLSFKELTDIIHRDELHVTSEEQVFEAVMNWMNRDPELRKKDLPPLLGKVRLPLLSPHYLADRVATEELIRTSHECRDLLDEARDYHLMPERRPLLQSFRTRPRCCNFIIGHIFAVGGLTKSGDSLSTVEVFDPLVGRWQMAEAMTMLRSRVGVAVMRNRLYAFGGYNGTERLSTVEVFNPVERVWSRVSPMHCKRSAVGAAALNDRLYVCGGYDGITSLNTVECYQPDKDEWTLIASMVKHRSAGGVVAFEGYIYALGGHDGLSIFDSVERYDPLTQRWTTVKPMLSRRCRLGVATLNGKIYVCGGYDGSVFLQTVEMFDPATNEWKFVAPMNVMRSRVALVANMGKLWAIGGYDGNSNLSTVEVYDPQSNTWSFVASMCAHEGGVGVGVIPICKPPD
ncbi:kelch-like protein 18 [Frankliniella occidentalis]|uniref:Kelch-like protein diablo n=1 Tax=Frankliniella occidentalis TaxID=133901 RepID=A0A6J1S3U1_FRAOC|nr:kelch-like protein 18 [Frankliniella occidentalis]